MKRYLIPSSNPAIDAILIIRPPFFPLEIDILSIAVKTPKINENEIDCKYENT